MAQRRRRSGDGAERAAPPARRPGRAGWRRTIDSWGGFTVIGVVLVALVILGGIVWVSLPRSASTDELMGEAIEVGPRTHINSLDEMEIATGRPPVGGPHFPRWQSVGVYDERVSDGLAVHALEHGVIWISYNPSLISDEDLSVMQSVGGDYRQDVIVSPRPENSMPIAVASWGQLLTLDHADRSQLKRFVETNRNRSPEPGVR